MRRHEAMGPASPLAPVLLQRWLVWACALAISLVPAWLYLAWLPGLDRFARLLNLALIWLVAALAPGGFSPVGSRGTVYLAGSGWIVMLVFWALLGLAFAWALRRRRLSQVIWLALPLVLATGLLAQLLLRLVGIGAYADV
jgi:MYXO-CTERM domain-containing protein